MYQQFYIIAIQLLSLFLHYSYGQTTVTVRSAALVIGAQGSFNLGAGKSVKDVLDGYGIPYDVVEIPQTGLSGSFNLETASAGLYSVIVFADGDVQFYDATTATYPSAITPAQMAQIEAYEIKYKARRVMMNIFPNNDRFGTTFVSACCNYGVENILKFNPTTLATTNSGINPAANLSTMGLYHYSATITNSTLATPLLTSSAGVVGIITSRPNGRREMIFHIAFGDFSTTSALLHHLWISWGLRGIYAGYRRVLLSTQIDDIYLSTELWDPALNTTNENTPYRLTTTDLTAHVTWQNGLNARLSAGSAFKIELAFNGNGVLIQTNTTPVFLDQIVDADYEYVKPNGTGYTWWPANYPANPNWPLTSLNRDPLFSYTRDSTRASNYFWLSHSFTHESLNNVTSSDVNKEIYYNQLFANMSTLFGKAYYSSRAIVTPRITGLFSGDALANMFSRGLRSAVGDNSRPNLLNPTQLHWGITTSSSVHGFDGFYIIPRFPTEIYFHCSTTSQNLAVYNYIYGSLLGKTTDFNVLLSREAQRVVRAMLNLRKDPHMFHQANMRTSGITTITLPNGLRGSFSLLQIWVEYMTTAFRSMVLWPIRTLKQDDLYMSYLDREVRDKCEYQLYVTFDNTTSLIRRVQLQTKNACTVPVATTNSFSSTPTGASVERFGTIDPFTYWISSAANGVTNLAYATNVVW